MLESLQKQNNEKKVALAQSWTDGVCDCVIVMISGLIVAQGRQQRYSMSRHSKATAKRASGKLAFVFMPSAIESAFSALPEQDQAC